MEAMYLVEWCIFKHSPFSKYLVPNSVLGLVAGPGESVMRTLPLQNTWCGKADI